MPSNVSKEWSRTKGELTGKYEKISDEIIEKHLKNDIIGEERAVDRKKLERFEKQEKKILEFLETYKDRRDSGGSIIQSNVIDNERGKIQGLNGVNHGYNGIVVVDSKKHR